MVVLDTLLDEGDNADFRNFDGDNGGCRCPGLFFLVVVGSFVRLRVGFVAVCGRGLFMAQPASV